jgi:hypothetical protein
MGASIMSVQYINKHSETIMDELSSSTLRLVHRFVKRQEVVAQAIGELRPNWRQRAGVSPVGNWGENKEWKYRLHGLGCELTNVETGEPLHWDVIGLTTFDRTWFAHFVGWLFDVEPDNPDCLVLGASGATGEWYELSEFIAKILNTLVDNGYLSTEGNWKGIKYTVVE